MRTMAILTGSSVFLVVCLLFALAGSESARYRQECEHQYDRWEIVGGSQMYERHRCEKCGKTVERRIETTRP